MMHKENAFALCVVPTVTTFRMDACMASLAQGFQVLTVMSSTLRQRKHMMNLLGWCINTFCKAFFTKWMSSGIAVTDALPCMTVATLGGWVSIIMFVGSGFLLGMLLTEATVREIRTAWIRTGRLRFSRHQFHLLAALEKPCRK